jgi:hypothetical protein
MLKVRVELRIRYMIGDSSYRYGKVRQSGREVFKNQAKK